MSHRYDDDPVYYSVTTANVPCRRITVSTPVFATLCAFAALGLLALLLVFFVS